MYKDCRLEWPSLNYWNSYVKALKEGFVLSTEKRKTKEEIERILISPYKHLQSINQQGTEIELPNGTRVTKQPFDIYWLIKGSQFIGAVGIIHYLNEYLKKYGGHLGVGIHPSFQSQGYGEVAIRLILARAFQLNINPVCAYCDSKNKAMAKVFEKCGGILDAVRPNPYFKGTCVAQYKIYWNKNEVRVIIERNLIPYFRLSS
jgi:predicted acetyltransferase